MTNLHKNDPDAGNTAAKYMTALVFICIAVMIVALTVKLVMVLFT